MAKYRDEFFNARVDKETQQHVVGIIMRSIDRAFLRYTYYKKFGRPPTAADIRAQAFESSPTKSPAFISAISQIVGGGDENLGDHEGDEDDCGGRQLDIHQIEYDKNKRTPFTMNQYKNFEQMLKNAAVGKDSWRKPNDGGPPAGAWTSESGRRNPKFGVPNRFVEDPRDRYEYPILHRGRRAPGGTNRPGGW